MARKISQEREAKIVQLYQDGTRPSAIAKELKVGENTVQRVLDRNGIERSGPTYRRIKSYQQVEIGNRYESGENPTQLAEEFGISLTTLREIVRERGAKVNNRGGRYRKFTDEEIQIMQSMSDGGFSQESIARSLVSSQNTISRVMRENGIQPGFRGKPHGEKHGSYKGGRHVTNSGYIEVLLDPSDPMARFMRNRIGYVLEHRLVLARALGRPLARYETVHHINGDKQDNRLENLQLRIGNHGKNTVYCCADCGSRNIVQCEIG